MTLDIVTNRTRTPVGYDRGCAETGGRGVYVCICSHQSCHTSPRGPLGVWYGLAVAGNAYRVGRKQRNLVLDTPLDDQIRAMAVACGVSVNEFIVRVLEREVAGDGVGGVVPGVAGASQAVQRRFGAERGRDGSGVAGVGAGDGRVAGVSPDWGAIMAAGRRRPEPVYQVDTVEVDPLEEIA